MDMFCTEVMPNRTAWWKKILRLPQSHLSRNS
jgi:hypothetical protein